MSAAAAPAATDAAEAAPKKGKKKLIIIIAAVAVLLAALGGGAAFYFKKKAADEAAAAADDDDGDAAPAHKSKSEHKKDDHHAVPSFVPLDPFVVNLADREVDRFAQIGITLEVEDAHTADTIKAYLPAIRNNILLLLSRKTSADLAGADGKEKLAREVLRESVRPMGIELDDESEAPAAEAADGAKKPKKKKRADPLAESPIKSVQFSSFIIQ